MKYININNKSETLGFKEAVIKGIADDQGLFMPEYIPKLFDRLVKKGQISDFHETAFEIAKTFIGNDIPDTYLYDIVNEALNFDIPLVQIESNIYSLELFHGPTLAFKDVGARFLAKCMGYFSRETENITVLVATSGDTGSAVANGFLGVEGIDVIVLYPSGKVSHLQEKQFTTLGNNITAVEIKGTFDDCQQLVKEAFSDEELKRYCILTSANSINIARLLPQSFYYFHAWNQLSGKDLPVVFSVPSGNYGNLTAGLIARKMGLPVSKFIIGSNINRPVPDYLETGKFRARPSVETYANAMDVGNPSNFKRILDLYEYNYNRISDEMYACSYNNGEIIGLIQDIYNQTNYIADPHGATAYGALKNYIGNKSMNGIFLETAHPAKFSDIIEKALTFKIEIPKKLKLFEKREKKSILMNNDYIQFKEFLLETK